ncbi:MAG TPA: efflux RND transporter periplasmic adaptor subunit [Bryobacteraceae bacterium]|nr:efflux RND transporter periplasmic adaptor subunit [Bryobacteraceae bacterium]
MYPKPYRSSILAFFGSICSFAVAQPVDVVPVRSEAVQRTSLLPGELMPYQRVSLHARANGFVERVLVDRGSLVRQGQLLATIVAPELKAQTAEAESRVQSAEAMQAEAEARLAGLEATYERLKAASLTPGAIAGLELLQAEKNAEAARAAVRSAESTIKAAQAAMQAMKQSEAYLNLVAPFSGIITERFAHPGALVGPGNAAMGPMLELEQVSRLRLIVPVPEASVSSVRRGARVPFIVPAYPGRTFNGTVARLDRSLDPKTRTMAVELDVVNSRNDLSPGMYPQVSWPAAGGVASLLVPSTAIVTTTERTFVIRVVDERAEWVNVRRGTAAGELVEVLGELSAGDLVVRRATDEMREGTRLQVRRAK